MRPWMAGRLCPYIFTMILFIRISPDVPAAAAGKGFA
jgi:hypothetical protein